MAMEFGEGGHIMHWFHRTKVFPWVEMENLIWKTIFLIGLTFFMLHTCYVCVHLAIFVRYSMKSWIAVRLVFLGEPTFLSWGHNLCVDGEFWFPSFLEVSGDNELEVFLLNIGLFPLLYLLIGTLGQSDRDVANCFWHPRLLGLLAIGLVATVLWEDWGIEVYIPHLQLILKIFQ